MMTLFVRLPGPGGALFDNSLQTPLIRAEDCEDLRQVL